MEQFEIHNQFYDSIEDILTEVDFLQIGKKHKDYISNVASVFDIETSSFYIDGVKQCCMYAWVFGINGKCIRGRTWEEFENVINRCVEYYGLSTNKRLIVYVHNLAYEFQFIKHRFEWEDIFSLDTRKPLYAITKTGIEFRCSYLLSGLSLKVVGENLLKYKVKKMVGDLDYNLIRHSKTPLNDKEWGYILNDGLVVMAFIQEEIERLGTIKKLPYTKTGYVRDLCKENCLNSISVFNYRKIMKRLTMTSKEYKQLRHAYSGGFTHANHCRVDKENLNVSSFDFTSSYPAVMLSEKYPMSKAHYVAIKSKEDFERYTTHYCCMFDLILYNVEAKVNYEHYISRSRCLEIEDYWLDNGRVISANKVHMVVTEQDYFIIKEMYRWRKMEVANFRYYYKDYLPKEIIMTILDLYQAKTTLKGVEGKEAEYLASKGMINSVYGMCVTDPCKDLSLYEEERGWFTQKNDLEEMIEHYNNSYNRTLYYPWGVWVTAYARRNLFTGINEFKDDYIYSDTDSIKVFNRLNHMEYIENYNKTIKKKINDCLSYYDIPLEKACPKTIKGIEKPLGVWDFEGDYTRFKTLGAKRYIYEENGEIHLTISGVKKTSGVAYLKHKYKTNDNIFKHFEENLVFPAEYCGNDGEIECASGKLCHTYLDNHMNNYVTDYLGNTYVYEEYSGVHMEATSYEMTLDEIFRMYILGDISMKS